MARLHRKIRGGKNIQCLGECHEKYTQEKRNGKQGQEQNAMQSGKVMRMAVGGTAG